MERHTQCYNKVNMGMNWTMHMVIRMYVRTAIKNNMNVNFCAAKNIYSETLLRRFWKFQENLTS
jgi:hypothetical protein